jgi:NTE family protein
MIGGPIDLSTVRYLTFEGGGGKGLAHIGAVAAIERAYHPFVINPKRGDIPYATSGEAVLSVNPIINLKIPPEKRAVLGVSGASAGAIVAFLVAMGRTSSQIYDLFNRNNESIDVGYATRREGKPPKQCSLFETFFDSPAAEEYRSIFEGRPRIKRYENKAASGLNEVVLSALSRHFQYEIYTTPEWQQKIDAELLLRKLFATDDSKAEVEIGYDNMAQYFLGLLFNRGFMPGLGVRKGLVKIMTECLIDPVSDWYGQFPEIPKNAEVINFRHFFEITGVDLIVTGSNVSQQRPSIFSVASTPDFPVVEAIGISMNIPLLFRPVLIETPVYLDHPSAKVDINRSFLGLHVDGGMLNNYPRHVFDFVHRHPRVRYKGQVYSGPIALSRDLFDTSACEPVGSERVLGFRLADEPQQGDQGYKIGPEFKPDDPFVLGTYAGGLVETLLYPSSNYQVRSDEDDRMTIVLNSHGLSVIDFASIAGDISRGMYERADTKTKRISDAYDRTLNHLQ